MKIHADPRYVIVDFKVKVVASILLATNIVTNICTWPRFCLV